MSISDTPSVRSSPVRVKSKNIKLVSVASPLSRLARNQNNVSELSDMSTRRQLFQ